MLGLTPEEFRAKNQTKPIKQSSRETRAPYRSLKSERMALLALRVIYDFKEIMPGKFASMLDLPKVSARIVARELKRRGLIQQTPYRKGYHLAPGILEQFTHTDQDGKKVVNFR
jgi:hypothetical protein